ANGSGLFLVDLERSLVLEDDAVCLAGELDRGEVVEDVLSHLLGRALERVSVAGRARRLDADDIASRAGDPGHLGRELLFIGFARILRPGTGQPVETAEDPARRVGVPVALGGVRTGDQEAVLANDADTSAPSARGRRCRSQLVALAADREAHVQLL